MPGVDHIMPGELSSAERTDLVNNRRVRLNGYNSLQMYDSAAMQLVHGESGSQQCVSELFNGKRIHDGKLFLYDR